MQSTQGNDLIQAEMCVCMQCQLKRPNVEFGVSQSWILRSILQRHTSIILHCTYIYIHTHKGHCAEPRPVFHSCSCSVMCINVHVRIYVAHSMYMYNIVQNFNVRRCTYMYECTQCTLYASTALYNYVKFNLSKVICVHCTEYKVLYSSRELLLRCEYCLKPHTNDTCILGVIQYESC